MKRIISILITVVMLAVMIPTSVTAAETVCEPIVASADCVVSGSTKQSTNLNHELNERPDSSTDGVGNPGGRVRFYINVNNSGEGDRTIEYMSFKLPDIPQGKTVTSAKLTLYSAYAGSITDNTNYVLRFYEVDSAWQESAITWLNQPLYSKILKKDDTGETYPYNLTTYPGEPAMSTVVPTSVLSGTWSAPKSIEVDIVGLVRNYLSSGKSDEYDFSIAIAPWLTNKGSGSFTTNLTAYMTAREHSVYHPSLTLTLDDIPAFSVESVTPAEGEKISSDDTVTFNFNNNIDETSVTPSDFLVKDINGSSIEITNNDFDVSGSAIVLKKSWDSYGYYAVSLGGISDVYGQNLTGTCSTSFEVTGDSLTKTITSNYLRRLKSDTGAFEVETSSGWVKTGGYYVLFKFALPSDIDNYTVIGADFDYYTDGYDNQGYKRVRRVPDYTWTSDAGTDTEYLNSVKAVFDNSDTVYYEADIATTMAKGSYHAVANVLAPVSDTINDANAGNYVTFALYHNQHALQYRGVLNQYGNELDPKLTLNLVSKSFGAVEASPAKGGVMAGVGDNIELTLATTIADSFANDTYIQLQDMDGNKVDANISVNGSKVTIDPVDDLAAYKEYKVVLIADIEDAYGTKLESDKVIHRFTSGSALVFNEIKFTDEVAPVYDATNVITGYDAGDEITAVTKFENTSGIDLPVLMIIAIYDSDNSLIKVDAVGGPFDAQANQTIQFSKTIEVPANAVDTYIEAFAWNNLEDMRPVCLPGRIEQN